MLGFHDEAAAFVEVDESGGDAAVAIVELDGSLEDVGVVAVVGARGIGARDGEQVAQLVEERLEVGALAGAGGGPLADEIRNGLFPFQLVGLVR